MLDHAIIEAAENIRKIPLKSGNIVHIKREDPYGHWMIHLDKGKTPAMLTGAYTKAELAYRAINAWLEENSFEAGIPEPKAPPVAVKTKRRKMGETEKLEFNS